MRQHLQFYIDGAWVPADGAGRLDVINPATEMVAGQIALGNAVDVDRAVMAARRAFTSWSVSSVADRVDLIRAIVEEYQKRMPDLADALTEEMGAPVALARGLQVPTGLGHFAKAIEVLQHFKFAEDLGGSRVMKEPIGVCGLITPWNWPLNQMACKVAPALDTGCTMVLKPSEVAPFSGHILAEILHDAGVPAGVFNLVHGDGLGVGVPLSLHPQVDMMSFTGSTRAGVEVARNAAPTVKRVAQELGGKSPNILLDDASLAANVAASVKAMMTNSGQTCSAATRMLVPVGRIEEVVAAAAEAAGAITVGDPLGNAIMGPVVSKAQFDKVQLLIQSGIDEGARLVAGGTGRPEGLEKGFFVRPTIFAGVTAQMTIAREEIFGPVLCIMTYGSLDEAVTVANDSEYGLAAYIRGEDLEQVRAIAARLRAGQVSINGAFDMAAPFGGYKMSGNGREWGEYGFHDYLEVKAIVGFYA